MPNYELINDKLLQVQLRNEQVFSKTGAMLAYKGQVSFARSFLGSGGVQDLAMRSVTNEGLNVMVGSGSGDVLYGFRGQYVMIVSLSGETFYVESGSVLAFDARLRTGTSFAGNQGGLQGLASGAMTGHGMFTSTFEGVGELAILSDGNAIALDVTPNNPIFVDPNAYIGYKGQLSSTVVTDVSWKTFIGQGSGESFQLKFTGSGTVYIQASER